MAIIKPNNNTLSSITALPAAISTGKVLQAVTFTYSTQESTSSTSFVASSVTASITPSSSSNKVLIMVSGTQTTSGNASHNVATIYRGSSTNLGDSSYGISYASYTMYFRATAAHSQTLQNAGAKSTIILLEIAG